MTSGVVRLTNPETGITKALDAVDDHTIFVVVVHVKLWTDAFLLLPLIGAPLIVVLVLQANISPIHSRMLAHVVDDRFSVIAFEITHETIEGMLVVLEYGGWAGDKALPELSLSLALLTMRVEFGT